MLVQLHDAARRPIGALGLMYRYKPGDDVEARVRQPFATRDALARAIPSHASLISRS